MRCILPYIYRLPAPAKYPLFWSLPLCVPENIMFLTSVPEKNDPQLLIYILLFHVLLAEEHPRQNPVSDVSHSAWPYVISCNDELIILLPPASQVFIFRLYKVQTVLATWQHYSHVLSYPALCKTVDNCSSMISVIVVWVLVDLVEITVQLESRGGLIFNVAEVRVPDLLNNLRSSYL